MASFNIHLAVGKRYAEKSNLIENLEDFYRGLVAPDLVDDKKFSHFSGILDKSNLIDYLSNKVLLNEYLLAKEVNSCYEKGVFLHLVTDYLFFNDFFDKWYLENISYENFCKDLYFSYNLSNNYLEKKYKLKHSVSLDLIEENIKKNRKEKKINVRKF